MKRFTRECFSKSKVSLGPYRALSVYYCKPFLPLLCCIVTCDSLNMVRKRFLSSSSGARSISSGVKRVLSWGGGGGVRFECKAGGEGLRSLSILLLFRLFCCTSSSRRPTVVRLNAPRNSNF